MLLFLYIIAVDDVVIRKALICQVATPLHNLTSSRLLLLDDIYSTTYVLNILKLS